MKRVVKGASPAEPDAWVTLAHHSTGVYQSSAGLAQTGTAKGSTGVYPLICALLPPLCLASSNLPVPPLRPALVPSPFPRPRRAVPCERGVCPVADSAAPHEKGPQRGHHLLRSDH